MTNDTTTLNGALSELGKTMASNLNDMDVEADVSDGLTTLADKILEVQHFTDGLLLVADNNYATTDETVNITAIVMQDGRTLSGKTVQWNLLDGEVDCGDMDNWSNGTNREGRYIFWDTQGEHILDFVFNASSFANITINDFWVNMGGSINFLDSTKTEVLTSHSLNAGTSYDSIVLVKEMNTVKIYLDDVLEDTLTVDDDCYLSLFNESNLPYSMSCEDMYVEQYTTITAPTTSVSITMGSDDLKIGASVPDMSLSKSVDIKHVLFKDMGETPSGLTYSLTNASYTRENDGSLTVTFNDKNPSIKIPSTYIIPCDELITVEFDMDSSEFISFYMHQPSNLVNMGQQVYTGSHHWKFVFDTVNNTSTSYRDGVYFNTVNNSQVFDSSEDIRLYFVKWGTGYDLTFNISNILVYSNGVGGE